MALTRPRFGQLNTSVVAESDPITVLHQGASQANVDVGFLFNRANGLVSNVALYWSESGQSIVTAFTSNSGATDSNIAVSSYANLTVGNVLLINGTIGINGNLGLAGQYIVSTGTGMAWTNATFAGGTITNALTVGNATVSTSTSTGALVVTGGAGIAGNVFAGNLLASGFFYANGTPFVSSSYGNVQMLSNLAATSNSIAVGSNLTVGGSLIQGTVPILTSSSATSLIATAPQAIDWFSSTAYRTAKYVISTTDVTNSWYQSTEIILVQDGTTSTIATYGLISSSGNTRMSFSSNIVSGNVILWATGVSANNTAKVQKMLIPA